MKEGRMVCPVNTANDTTVAGSPKRETLGLVSLQGAASKSHDPPKPKRRIKMNEKALQVHN